MHPPADFAPVRFSTWDLPERDRLDRWREEFGRRIIGVEIEPRVSHARFFAKATLQALPGCRIARCDGSAGRLNRTAALAADGDDSIGLVVNLGANIVMSQRGRDVPLQQDEATLLMHQEPAALTHGNLRFYGLVFPRAALAARISDLDLAMMRAIPRSAGPLRLLVCYLDLIRKEADLSAPEVRRSVVGHIQDLTALAFGAKRDTTEQSLSAVAAARLAAALAHIKKSFAEPGLTVDTIARGQGISSRYLQELLEASGKSFTARVNELRLQKAFGLLVERGGGKRRISDIALEAGFPDVSHFNRLFRARFGDTPSSVRGGGDAGQ
jgi:AraC-like DNA-binding protein